MHAALSSSWVGCSQSTNAFCVLVCSYENPGKSEVGVPWNLVKTLIGNSFATDCSVAVTLTLSFR